MHMKKHRKRICTKKDNYYICVMALLYVIHFDFVFPIFHWFCKVEKQLKNFLKSILHMRQYNLILNICLAAQFSSKSNKKIQSESFLHKLAPHCYSSQWLGWLGAALLKGTAFVRALWTLHYGSSWNAEE